MATAAAPSRPTGSLKSKGKLEDHAAVAALYVTKNDASAKKAREYIDSNNKLSSAGAAASLKYARPQDLPSFPSSGLKKNNSAAGAAASLGWANQKTFEHWKPDPSASASAAAVMAKDYKMKPLWQPEPSMSGAKAAALAHRDGGKVEAWKPEASAWGNSAASRAFKKYPAGESTPVDYGYTTLGRQGSLMAATGAMSSNRKRAESTPLPLERYPDERNASGNAMKAAISVSKNSKSELTGGSIPYTNMPREMFTSHPPVAPEVIELNRQNTLRASAVAMARGVYAQQQKSLDAATDAKSGAKSAHKRRPSDGVSEDPQPMYLGNLQEAARKLAQERLSKLHNDLAKNQEYKEYYGHTKPASRLSIRGRTRHRASSDGTFDEDREQSNKIRAQMSIFSSNVVQVDEKKRAKDREALIAAAQRNVTKSLHGMDEKVFADTGKVAPSLLSDWEIKAHAAAQAKSIARLENHGKVDIGGGKFMDQSEVDSVAARNVQPVLDEINEKATIERDRLAAIKIEQLEQQRKLAESKQREKERKETDKKLRQQDKEEEKLRKADEKATKEEEKRAEKEKRKSAKATPVVVVSGVVAASVDATEAMTETAAEVAPSDNQLDPPRPVILPTIRTSTEDQASLRMGETANAANAEEVTPVSPTSPKDGNKVKTWLKSKLSRRLSKNPRFAAGKGVGKGDDKGVEKVVEKDGEENAEKMTEEDGDKDIEKELEVDKTENLAVGTGLKPPSAKNSTTSLGAHSSSMREVAMAGKGKEAEIKSPEEAGLSKSSKRNSAVSNVSSLKNSDDDEFQEARDEFDVDRIQPSAFPAETRSSSVARDSKFTENI